MRVSPPVFCGLISRKLVFDKHRAQRGHCERIRVDKAHVSGGGWWATGRDLKGSRYMSAHLFESCPVDLVASDARLIGQDVAHDALVDRVLRWRLVEFEAVVFAVYVVANADELAVAVEA